MVNGIFVQTAAMTAILILLIIGAYTDATKRIIPNAANLGILICGVFTPGAILVKAVCAVVVVAALLISTKATGLKSGGGDVKLYIALSFALTVFPAILIFGFAILLVKIQNAIKHKKTEKGERYPICCYVAPGYALYFIVYIAFLIKSIL